ncbi:MAG TPA: M28 family peptidase [Archangium sp.]|uniref:M28 family peptidase n=1 Tax=Archangium sp. TaxID=1872627 RepID=UPI002E35D4DF|nr:M28 family peptidase [Archangium sp.]HEX5746346.1 M28 family peptidase [Archangium sp.]
MNRSSTRTMLLAGALLGTAACAPVTPLDTTQLPPIESMIQEIDKDRLMLTVADLVATHKSEEPMDCSLVGANGSVFPELCNLTRVKAGELMYNRLQQLGTLTMSRQVVAKDKLTASNVIAEYKGVKYPEEVVLISAHFDAYYAAADDNSTGVAAVLEIARVLSQYKFDRTLRFVGFDLEEYAYVGSARYVESLREKNDVVLAVNFDSLGYYSDEPGSQQGALGLPAPSQGNFLTVLGNDNSLARVDEISALNDAFDSTIMFGIVTSGLGNNAGSAPLLRSDHGPFWLSGHQAIFITDTAYFRNPGYHNPKDTIDVLDPVRFHRAVQISAAAIAYWAGGPR